MCLAVGRLFCFGWLHSARRPVSPCEAQRAAYLAAQVCGQPISMVESVGQICEATSCGHTARYAGMQRQSVGFTGSNRACWLCAWWEEGSCLDTETNIGKYEFNILCKYNIYCARGMRLLKGNATGPKGQKKKERKQKETILAGFERGSSGKNVALRVVKQASTGLRIASDHRPVH